jgi:hypothetical protein
MKSVCVCSFIDMAEASMFDVTLSEEGRLYKQYNTQDWRRLYVT